MFKQTNFKQRFTSLLLVALLLMGSMIPTVLATETQAPPCATTDSDVQAINPEASIECGTERIQATLSTHEAADKFAATIQNQIYKYK